MADQKYQQGVEAQVHQNQPQQPASVSSQPTAFSALSTPLFGGTGDKPTYRFDIQSTLPGTSRDKALRPGKVLDLNSLPVRASKPPTPLPGNGAGSSPLAQDAAAPRPLFSPGAVGSLAGWASVGLSAGLSAAGLSTAASPNLPSLEKVSVSAKNSTSKVPAPAIFCTQGSGDLGIYSPGGGISPAISATNPSPSNLFGSLVVPTTFSFAPIQNPAAAMGTFTAGKEPASAQASMPMPAPQGISRPSTSGTSTSKDSGFCSTPASRCETEPKPEDEDDFAAHLHLLNSQPEQDQLNEIRTTPIFTSAVRKYAQSVAATCHEAEQPFSQFGLLAGNVIDDKLAKQENGTATDPRLFWNISAPSSFFICGSQGSGKSHTMSCLLENALAPCRANKLPHPLTAIMFHYDTFISDVGGSACEAACLSSDPSIRVRVLCPPTNIGVMKKLYQRFGNVKVEELRLKSSDLNTKRMLDLMAVSTTGGTMPLYLHVVSRILRELRIQQQNTNAPFSYTSFKQMMSKEDLTDMQLAPLKQRLDTLESFMVDADAKAFDMFGRGGGIQKPGRGGLPGTDWTPTSGSLTIVDLSCPCVTADMACSLFNICLGLFLEQDISRVGRIVALDEAHKYMNETQSCSALTENLLSTIRLQRHLGARVIISTQEPTVSPKLLDLCSVTVVHRFTSPDWLNALRCHLAGVSEASRLLTRAAEQRDRLSGADKDRHEDGNDDKRQTLDGLDALEMDSRADPALELFSRIVNLRIGEALMFAPSAIIAVPTTGGAATAGAGHAVKRLAHGVLKVRIRQRITTDGGRSIMAV